MDLPGSGRPGDRRNFVHKRLIGAVTGGIGSLFSGGNPITGAIGGFAKGGTTAPAPVRGSRLITSTVADALNITFPQGGGCPPGFFRDRSDNCVPLKTRVGGSFRERVEAIVPFGRTGQVEFGSAVMGQFGAALEPGVRTMDTRVCPRGTVLGVDGLCYNHRDIKNSERAWPRGRRPLLTGGDMRCISVAASAAKKLERKTKQLQSMGMLKKPAARRGQRALPSGHHAHVQHD